MRPSRRRSGYTAKCGFNVSAFMVMRGINMIVLARGCYRMLRHEITFGDLMALQLLAGG